MRRTYHETLYKAVASLIGERPGRVEVQIAASENGAMTVDRNEWVDEFDAFEDAEYLTLRKAAKPLARLPVGAAALAHVWVGAMPSADAEEYVGSFTVSKTAKGWIAVE